MIYTASSRALACLENLVHRSAIGLHENFRTLIIEIPDSLPITIVKESSFITGWQGLANYAETQTLGDEWIVRGDSAVLKVPSAIIPEESNYLLNPAHPDFKRIRLAHTELFRFDQRLG